MRSTICLTGGLTRVVLLRVAMPSGDVVKIGLPILVIAFAVALTHHLMSNTRLGRQVYAFGGNPEAASRIGVNVLGVQVFAYGYLGFLASVGGFIQAYRVHQAVPTAMAGQELNVLAVAILGGASMAGGVGHDGRRGARRALPGDAAERPQPHRSLLLFLRGGDRTRDPRLDRDDRIRRAARPSKRHRAVRLMDRSVPEGKAHTLSSELDRVIAAMRRGGAGMGGLVTLLMILVLFFSLAEPIAFPRGATVQAMMFQLPELGLLSLAMAIPLVSGGINLAIIATANLAGLLMAWMLTRLMPSGTGGVQLALWLSGTLVAGFVLCVVVGVVTGVLVAFVGVHPILVTLGTMTLLHGVGIYFTRGRTLSGFPDPLLAVSNGTVLGVPISFILFMLVAVAAHVLLTRRALGVRIHMVGSNLEAARFSGVDTRKVLIRVYLLSSLLCWLAAIVMMARFNSAGADIAQSYLLITILAAILGGIDPYGGFGRIAGLVVALVVLQVISSGFNIVGLSPQLALASWGLILLLVMAIKRVSRARA